MKRRDSAKMAMYKDAIGVCCMPDCNSGLHLETHHIIPIAKGGDDSYSNYIVLCGKCHRTNNLHSKYSENLMELYLYKFYMEKLIIGYDSDDNYHAEEFARALYTTASRRYQENQNIEKSRNGACAVDGCTKTAKVSGYCCFHYCEIIAPGRKRTPDEKKDVDDYVVSLKRMRLHKNKTR